MESQDPSTVDHGEEFEVCSEDSAKTLEGLQRDNELS